MNEQKKFEREDRDYKYAKEAMAWYGWGSPIGLSIAFSLIVASLSLFIWVLHLVGFIR